MQTPTTSPEEQIKELLLEEELALLSELHKGLEQVEFRVGDDASLQRSVSRVIVDTLRDAGVADHDRLSGVLAPLIVESLRAEIHNSRDMMVDALYPITGRLVAAAVRNAFRDLVDTLDQRLNQTLSVDRLKIRAQALVTRQSAAELMLRKFPPFALEELLVIQRSSGLLISHWIREESEGEGVESDLVGAMLSAIMSFTRDAFGDREQGELNNLEFGGATLFIRASPVMVVAVKARGTAPHGFDTGLDELFVDFVERWGKAVADPDHELGGGDRSEVVADLHGRVGQLLARKPKKPLSAYRNAFVVLGLIVALLAGFWIKGWLDAREVRRIEDSARSVVAADPALIGYPLTVRYERDSEVLRVSGLVPDPQSLVSLRDDLAAAVPDASIDLGRIGVIPEHAVPATEPTPSERLADFTARSAIYFEREAAPRDALAAARVLDEAARLLSAAPPRVRLRVVAYSDGLGTPDANQRVKEARARWAADELAARGVPTDRLALLVYPGGQDLLVEPGEGSDNRRVEFEIAHARR